MEIKQRSKIELIIFTATINIEESDSNLLKIDKKKYKGITIYYIITKNFGDCENIHSVNSLYLITGKEDGHIEEKKRSKYLVFGSTDENKEVFS